MVFDSWNFDLRIPQISLALFEIITSKLKIKQQLEAHRVQTRLWQHMSVQTTGAPGLGNSNQKESEYVNNVRWEKMILGRNFM